MKLSDTFNLATTVSIAIYIIILIQFYSKINKLNKYLQEAEQDENVEFTYDQWMILYETLQIVLEYHLSKEDYREAFKCNQIMLQAGAV